MGTHRFIQGNTREGLDFEVTDEENNDAAIDLTDSTVKFRTSNPKLDSLLFEKTCTLTDPTNGKCRYTPNSGDMDTIGDYVGELEITFADSTVGYVHGINMSIEQKLPTS